MNFFLLLITIYVVSVIIGMLVFSNCQNDSFTYIILFHKKQYKIDIDIGLITIIPLLNIFMVFVFWKLK